MKAVQLILLASLGLTYHIATAADAPAVAASASVQNKEPRKGDPMQNLAAHKEKILQHIQDRMRNLEQTSNCVKAAPDHNSLRACMHQMREQHEKSMHEQRGPMRGMPEGKKPE